MFWPSQLSSQHQLETETAKIHTLFTQKETEETWKTFESCLLQFKAWIKQSNGCIHFENFVPCIRKNMKDPILVAVSRIFTMFI